MLRTSALFAFLLLLGACSPAPGDDDDTADPSDDDDDVSTGGFEEGPEVTCTDPVAGFDRLTDRTADLGIDLVYEPDDVLRACPAIPGATVIQDVDADGVLDVMFWERDRFPHLFAGDGDGGFMPTELAGATGGMQINMFAAVDLTGDGLPELVFAGEDGVGVAENLGNRQFGDVAMIYTQTGFPRPCLDTMAWGDIDGDHDLDLLLPRLTNAPDEDWVIDEATAVGTTDLLLLNDGGTFEVVQEFRQPEALGLSFLGVFSDRDDDGDLDVLIASEFGPLPEWPPTSFWRHDGLDSDGVPVLVNDAPAISANVPTSAMGFSSHDLNFDGAMDYCISDQGSAVSCLLSIGGEAMYVEAGLALGLSTDSLPDDCGLCWSQWSIIVEDLDGDGELDAASVAGPPPNGGAIGAGSNPIPDQPDVIWQGDGSGGFVERTAEAGWGDVSWNYGMAAADLFGDGTPEIVVGPWEGAPKLLHNPCSAGSWITVDLVGVGHNVESYGARVEVETGGRTRVRELHAVSGIVQPPSELMFSLGAATSVDRITVRWADGEVGETTDIGVNRRVTAYHPDAPR